MKMAIVIGTALSLAGCSSTSSNTASSGRRTNQATSAASLVAPSTDAEKEEYLSNFVRPDSIRRSFHAASGIWVDCVDVNLQPSMLTPAMAGRPVAQPPPLPSPAPDAGAVTSSPRRRGAFRLESILRGGGTDEYGTPRKCDPGTVPIRRTTAADLSRFATLGDFFSKGANRQQVAAALRQSHSSDGSEPGVYGYEYAARQISVTNWGLEATLDVWQPYVQAVAEHSISQLWVINIPANFEYTETAEVGWAVNPEIFGDYYTHSFIYWTADDYQSTGCYNLECAGFVQTNSSFTLGDWLPPSDPGGEQWELPVGCGTCQRV